MSDVVVTLKHQNEHGHEVDIALPKAVPFQQLGQILGEVLHIPELKALDESSSISGRINERLIIRPHETLDTVQVTDGAFLELIVTRKSRDGVEKDIHKKGPHLRSEDTDETFDCLGSYIRLGRSKRNTIAVGHLPNGQFVSDTNGHAAIMLRKAGYLIRDENSTNGTLLDGVELTPGREYPLRDGAKIQLGHKGPILYFYTN